MGRSQGRGVATTPPVAGAGDSAAQPTLLERIERIGLVHSGGWRATVLVGLLGILVLVALCSVAYGSKPIPFSHVLSAFFDYDGSNEHLIVRSLRVPRTLLGIGVGVALGLAGALMQGVTRNPLADPGILGVNAGASLAVVLAIYVLGATSLPVFVWFAFAGAALASVAVYGLSSMGRDRATPVKLALSGAALQALLLSFTQAILLLDVATLNTYRFWVVGSLAGRDGTVLRQVAPFLIVGTVLGLASARSLNTLSLGDDVARSLGQRVGLARATSALAIVVLSGSAVAAAGPIAFVGLTVPHVARAITGPDYRWVLPYSAVLAPILLLGSDVIGRLVLRPGELQVGIVTAVIGAPFFIMLVRRRKLAEL
jgi:iron complex transport system permease protein